MSEQNFRQFQEQHELILFTDKQTLFNKLQHPLTKIDCEKKIIQRICTELVSEGIFDAVELQRFISDNGDGDFLQLVWKFQNSEFETFLKFLDILTNLDDFPVTRGKFQAVINQVLYGISPPVESNINLNRTRLNQPNLDSRTNYSLPIQIITHNNQSDVKELEQCSSLPNDDTAYQEQETFLKKNQSNSNKKSKWMVVALVLIALALAGLSLYLYIRQNKLLKHLTKDNTSGTHSNSSEEQLPESTTFDSKIVESKVNESLFSYNFL